jgi:hypothetical protein
MGSVLVRMYAWAKLPLTPSLACSSHCQWPRPRAAARHSNSNSTRTRHSSSSRTRPAAATRLRRRVWHARHLCQARHRLLAVEVCVCHTAAANASRRRHTAAANASRTAAASSSRAAQQQPASAALSAHVPAALVGPPGVHSKAAQPAAAAAHAAAAAARGPVACRAVARALAVDPLLRGTQLAAAARRWSWRRGCWHGGGRGGSRCCRGGRCCRHGRSRGVWRRRQQRACACWHVRSCHCGRRRLLSCGGGAAVGSRCPGTHSGYGGGWQRCCRRCCLPACRQNLCVVGGAGSGSVARARGCQQHAYVV